MPFVLRNIAPDHHLGLFMRSSASCEIGSALDDEALISGLEKEGPGMTGLSIVIATQFLPRLPLPPPHVRRKYHVFLYCIPVYLPVYANSFVTSARVKRERESDPLSFLFYNIRASRNGARRFLLVIVLSQGTKTPLRIHRRLICT